MKKYFLFFVLLLSFGGGFAQVVEELTPEEKERRQRNIEAGNPFKEFGYTPKIATLSKGKYLEFHDLDSIVKIGSYSWHVKNKEVTGYTRIDPSDPESGLSPEVISRWLSPDPLAEEFPSWSPYNYVYNNPVRFIDPTGLAPEDWVRNKDGNIYWDPNATSQATTKPGETYLGKAVVVFDGTNGENLGEDGTLTGEGANPAKVTIYGPGGVDDVKTYRGLTTSSNPDKYSMIEEGYYEGFWQQMATSPFGRNSLTYRIKQLDGNLNLPIAGGEKNKSTGRDYMSQIFLHRTNWSGVASGNVSQGCLIIDARQWRDVEGQLGKINSFLIQVKRIPAESHKK